MKASDAPQMPVGTEAQGWKSEYLELIDIEKLRRTLPDQWEDLLAHCEKISYKDWSQAKKGRARWKPEKWYLVKNPPEPFLPVTAERLKSYRGKQANR